MNSLASKDSSGIKPANPSYPSRDEELPQGSNEHNASCQGQASVMTCGEEGTKECPIDPQLRGVTAYDTSPGYNVFLEYFHDENGQQLFTDSASGSASPEPKSLGWEEVNAATLTHSSFVSTDQTHGSHHTSDTSIAYSQPTGMSVPSIAASHCLDATSEHESPSSEGPAFGGELNPGLSLPPNPAAQSEPPFFNQIKTVPKDPQEVLHWVRDDDLLYRLAEYIPRARWFRIPGESETVESPLFEELVENDYMKNGDSAFRPFFTADANHYCLICRRNPKVLKPTERRSLQRALGHARRHFGYTIDGKHADLNTKKDMERRRGGKYLCELCSPPKEHLLQNRRRHERTHRNDKIFESSGTEAPQKPLKFLMFQVA